MAEINMTENLENSSLRVNLGLLDNLMNLAGELVLGRNQLIQALSVNDEKTLHSPASASIWLPPNSRRAS